MFFCSVLMQLSLPVYLYIWNDQHGISNIIGAEYLYYKLQQRYFLKGLTLNVRGSNGFNINMLFYDCRFLFKELICFFSETYQHLRNANKRNKNQTFASRVNVIANRTLVS